MDEIRPEHIGLIVGALIVVAILQTLFDQRHRLRRLAKWFVNRYFIINLNYDKPDTSESAPDQDVDPVDDRPEVPITTTITTPQQPVATPQRDHNALLLEEKAKILAKLIHNGKMTQTEGIKTFYGVSPGSSNPLYAAAREAVQRELAALQAEEVKEDYPELTKAGRPVASHLRRRPRRVRTRIQT